MKLIKKGSQISLLTIVILVIVISTIKLKNPQRNILSWDVFGFYLYLPANVIYDDPSIEDLTWVNDIISTYNNTTTLYQLSPTPEGKNIIRFTPGMSIMMSPFFMLGHAYASFTENNLADGFSKPYQWAIILAGLFYSIIGLIFLRKILLKFVSDKIAAIMLAVLYLSSNLFFFTTYGNDVPHVYVFTLNVLIIWCTIRWHESHKKIHAILIGLLLGLAVISRISEVLMLAVPVLWGVYNKESLIKKWKLIMQYKMQVLLMVLAGLLAIMPQFLYWKMASGGWLYWAYNDPGSSLDLLHPRFWWVLFGFRKGLFIYSPVMIFAFIGFYFLYKEKKEIFWPLILVTLFHVYLIASFTSLIAFGWRAFIELYAVLAIPLAFFIGAVNRSKLLIRIAIYALILGITILSLFQVWQLNHGILDGYRMTKDYYFRIFAKTKVTEEDRKYMLVQRPFTAIETLTNEDDYNKVLLQYFDFENSPTGHEKHYDTSYAHSGTMSLRMDATLEYSPTFRKEFRELSDSYYGWIRASVWIYPTANPQENNATMVVAFRHDKQNYKYKGFNMNSETYNLKLNQWNLITADYMTPELLSRSDELEVYIWYRGKENIWIDDLKIEFFDPKY